MLHILNLKTTDSRLLTEAIDILHKSRSIEYAQNTAKDMLSSAWNDLEDSLPTGPGKEKVSALSKYLIDRDI